MSIAIQSNMNNNRPFCDIKPIDIKLRKYDGYVEDGCATKEINTGVTTHYTRIDIVSTATCIQLNH
jgi:hypothetical protein